MKKLLLSFLCTLLISTQVFAQQDDGPGGDIFASSMTDAITVAAIGGFGAVLGLSTLSFVDEPSEHLKNIVVGGAIGVIVGVGVVAFKQATVSKDLYQESVLNGPANNPGMTTAMRTTWHKRNHYQINDNLGKENSVNMPGVNLQFSF
jgi:hypothetical protein